MIDVDNVYQKVLVLANKEQRGYITPQDFNLLADKAQMEILNDYFHGLKTAHQKPKNQTEISDEADMLREKMSYFRKTADLDVVSSTTEDASESSLPSDIYMLGNIITKSEFDSNGVMTYQGGNELIEVDRSRLLNMLKNPLTRPTATRPVYYRRQNNNETSTTSQVITIDIHPGNISALKLTIDYWSKPVEPKWGYVIFNKKALHNFNTSTNFQLHPSEEENLVMRILQLAGVSMEKPGLQQSVIIDKQTTKQNQNS